MQISLILHFAKQDMVDKYRNSLLGVLWNVILPLTMIFIFIFVFSKIMGAKLADFQDQPYSYAIYLISGILFWNLFASSSQRIANLFNEKKALIKKNHIELATLPLYVLITETVIFIISFSIFIGFLVYIQHPITLQWLLLIPVYVITLLLAYVIGFSVAIFAVFIKDIKEVFGVILQIWFWLTPIVYVIAILPQGVGVFYQVNPLYWVVQASQNTILYQQAIHWQSLALITAIALLMLWIIIQISQRLEKDIRDFI